MNLHVDWNKIIKNNFYNFLHDIFGRVFIKMEGERLEQIVK